MHHLLKVIHNSLSIKLENLEKASSQLDKLCQIESIHISKNVHCSNNIYDISLILKEENPRIEAMILNVMTQNGCIANASGNFQEEGKKMLFSLYI